MSEFIIGPERLFRMLDDGTLIEIAPSEAATTASAGTLTVTKVDRERGEITVTSNPQDAAKAGTAPMRGRK